MVSPEPAREVRGVKYGVPGTPTSEIGMVSPELLNVGDRYGVPGTPDAILHDHVAGKADVYFLRGRLRFGDNGQDQSAPFPSAHATWEADAVMVERLDAAFPDAWITGSTSRGGLP